MQYNYLCPPLTVLPLPLLLLLLITCDLIGLAIQWGAVGDVGGALSLLADDTVIAGTLPQRIISCLSTLDQLLRQRHTIVSSFIPAQLTRGITDSTSIASPRDVVARIIGD